MEKAYLVGLRAGDLNAWRKTRNTIEVRVSTTHPAMAKLFSESFGPYGHIMADAGRAYLPRRYRWQMKTHLDNSFEFLIRKASNVPKERGRFYRFLGGYSDSECCWCVYFSKNRAKSSWSIESTDLFLLRRIRDSLRTEGFHPLLYVFTKQKGQRIRKNQRPEMPERRKTGVLRLDRKNEVLILAEKLLLISRHGEKISKMRLIVGMSRMTKSQIVTNLSKLRRKIKLDVARFEEKAEREYKKGRR